MAKEVFGNSQKELEENILSGINENGFTADGIKKAIAKVIFENNKVITDDIYQDKQNFFNGLEQMSKTRF